jgi:hypothetical protein
MKQDQIQQGDVLLKRVEKPAVFKSTQRGGKIILAHGEHTGHHHAVEDSEAELVADGDRILLMLEREATLTHQEHGPVTVPAGCWEVGRVQEFDYLTQMARDVRD